MADFFRLPDLSMKAAVRWAHGDNPMASLMARWDVWRNIPRVGLAQAVFLSLGFDPDYLLDADSPNRLPEYTAFLEMTGFETRLKVAAANAQAGRLAVADGSVDLREFAAWALSCEPAWELPDEFPRALGGEQAQEKVEDFPEELRVAIEAYRALYANGKEPNQKHGPKAPIIKYVKEHYPHLSPEAIERIAVVANPHKRGGVSKSE